MCILGHIFGGCIGNIGVDHWCLRSFCVPLTAVFDEARGNLQDSDPL
jgi:hypothetical protein